MYIKILAYALFLFLSIYALSSVNFNNFFKTNKELEAKILYMLLSICMSYMLTNFVWDFLKL